MGCIMYEAVGAVLCSRVWCVFLFLRCGVVALVGVYGERRVLLGDLYTGLHCDVCSG